jgi:hypothetical protein
LKATCWLAIAKICFSLEIFGFARSLAILVSLTLHTSFVNKLAKTARSLACQRSKLGYTRYNAAP